MNFDVILRLLALHVYNILNEEKLDDKTSNLVDKIIICHVTQFIFTLFVKSKKFSYFNVLHSRNIETKL